MSVRTEKVGSVIKEAIAEQFQKFKPDFVDGMLSVVDVKVSPDVSIAKVYVSLFRTITDPVLIVKKLNARSFEYRKRLGPMVTLKILPELRFFLDHTVGALEHIDEVLKELKETNKF
ncbi:MAG: 30S ribosome-binding factor RbfA [Chlorobiota bacterium]|nr:30S ribosome-binding factor RbfA [Chlorobiota bacterium]QQS66403.1 MAG: 30S ribosome-binding factor RbfA [Chlorobiota bacterium]